MPLLKLFFGVVAVLSAIAAIILGADFFDFVSEYRKPIAVVFTIIFIVCWVDGGHGTVAILKAYIGFVAVVSTIAALIFGAAFFAFVSEHWKFILVVLAVIFVFCWISRSRGDGPFIWRL